MKHTIVVAKALIQNSKKEILLLHRSKDDDYRPGEWDLPGGSAEDDEDFTAAALREIQEETGLNFGHHDIHLAQTQMGRKNGKMVCYLNYIGKTDSSEIQLSTEHDDYCWLSLEYALETTKVDRHLEFLRFVRDNHFLD